MVAISAPRVFDGECMLEDHAVLIDDDRVLDVIPVGEVPDSVDTQILSSGVLAPGFIDLQVNGGGGVMFNNSPCRETLATIAAGHRPSGTTSLMPTLISDTFDVQQAAIDAVREARAHDNPAVLGIHIEGPFFDIARRGTHKASAIRVPQSRDIDCLSSLDDLNVIVTLAPDHVQTDQIAQLVKAGVHVCAGHTNASYEQIQDAIAAGLKGFTHLFNAMSPLAARQPGTVGAALNSDDTWVGIIADGHHVHPASIQIAHRMKPRGKLLLVTDAMSTVGSEAASFEIYGERIEECDGRLINSEGALAGSTIGMIDAVFFATSVVGLPLEETLRMASLYPAEFLGLDKELGRISTGYRADFVHFDADFRVHSTWLSGVHQAHVKKTGIPL
ncbi:MAG: N-acetylglucosamine-6-phosphate deacetylase [Halioglobus sp.]